MGFARNSREGRPAGRGLPAAWACLVAAFAAAPAFADLPVYDIRQLQLSGPELDWRSPHAGEIVCCVGGVVTHKFRQRIVIQDPALGGEWAAIEVRGYPVYPIGIEVGDRVDFTSVYVDEYRGVTTLQYYNASSHTVLSSGHPLPDPIPLAVWNLRYPAHPEDAERYAAMIVTLSERVTIGALDLGHAGDNYEMVSCLGDVAWGSDYANTDIDSTYFVEAGQCYARLTGLVQRYDNDAALDYYQLLPRGIDDYVACSNAVSPPNAGPRLRLAGAGQNPFRHETRLRLEAPAPVRVRLEVLDAAGRRLALLGEGLAPAGGSEFIWDGRDGAGVEVPSGVYLLRLVGGGWTATERVCRAR